MSLYEIYDICSVTLFEFIAHFYVLFLCISGFSEPHFLDIICMRFESFKSSAFCVSLVSLLISFIILFSNNQFVIMLGCDDIRVMPEGTYCYYVYATNEKGKTYTLPARINKIDRLQYYVENVYFKNGGYLYFPNGDFFEYDDTFNNYDQSDKEWEIELTNNKTFHEKVEETEPFKPTAVILPFVEIIIIWFSTILYILKIRKRNYYKI